MKIVSQLDLNGVFVGPVVADESPRDPGVYLLPYGTVDLPPPSVPTGHVARPVNGAWQFFAIEAEIESERPAKTQEQILAEWRAAASVSRFQVRVALYQAARLAEVEALMADPETPMLMKLAWADAQEFRRDGATVAAMAASLGLSGHQVDELFIAAAQITA